MKPIIKYQLIGDTTLKKKSSLKPLPSERKKKQKSPKVVCLQSTHVVMKGLTSTGYINTAVPRDVLEWEKAARRRQSFAARAIPSSPMASASAALKGRAPPRNGTNQPPPTDLSL